MTWGVDPCGAAPWGADEEAAGASYSVTLSGLTAISIAATSVQPQLDYTITGTPGTGTTYFAVYPSATTPTWDRSTGWSGTPTATGEDAGPPSTTTANDEPTITWDAALTPGTSYKLWAIWDDGASSSNSGAPFGSAAFTTDTLAELAATGATGTFSGTASSPATATLAATGATGSFAGTANSTTTATLAATGATGTFSGSAYTPATATLAATGESGIFVGTANSTTTASLAATGGTGAFAGDAGASSSVSLAATGATGTFSGSANSTATALLAAAGESGIFVGAALLSTAALAATGSTGTFSGSTSTQATATLAATGATGAFSGEAWTLGTASLEATGNSGTFAGTAEVPSGTADAADVWNYVLSNGKSAEQTAVEIHAMLLDLHRIHGLELGSPLTVTETSRQAGAVLQAISEAAGAVVVTRQ